MNLHIIQCDAMVHEDAVITSKEEFEHYIATLQLKGGGGTDFRPAFQYVDTLIRNHKFTNLKGMIYFTDGEGTYPAYAPEYRTAFVFLKDDYIDPQVPAWAMKLVLQKYEMEGSYEY